VDSSDPQALEPVSRQIGEFFTAGRIPPEIAQAISQAYAELCGAQTSIENQKYVAVRSSATAEDLPGASFAGQQDTYLNIRGEPAVLEAVSAAGLPYGPPAPWHTAPAEHRARSSGSGGGCPGAGLRPRPPG